MLDKGRDLDWFSSPFIVALGLIALVTFAFFLVWELTEAHPVVDLRLFALRNFSSGTIAISVSYALYFGNLVLLPQWMQEYLGYRAYDAGLVTAPVGIFTVLLSPFIGRLLQWFDARALVSVAFVGLSGVFFMRTQYLSTVDAWHLVIPTLLQGIPTVLWFVPLVSIILSGLPPERIPAAAGLSNFARIFCGAVGTSIAGTVWSHRTVVHHVRLTEQASIDNPAFNQAIATLQSQFHLDVGAAYASFESMVANQAAVMGLDDFFYASTFIFILIIPLIWITRPTKSGDSTEASAAH
jgi:DHA2 family multidrug resistance protein